MTRAASRIRIDRGGAYAAKRATKGGNMSRLAGLFSAAALLVFTAALVSVQGEHRDVTLVVTMTNDPNGNQIKVYDAATRVLLQTLSTHGKGGVGGNARGIRAYQGIVAVVNNGSGTVAVYRRTANGLRFDKVVTTTSAPVSVDFGAGHMYVAGATTVDSFVLHRNTVAWLDGTTWLELAGGGPPPDGSTAQVGSVNGRRLLVTLKTDPDPGTVDVVALHDGAITGAAPTAVSTPDGTLTPFGFSIYPDGTALITLAHSSQDGLFRNGAFTFVTGAGQAAPCWSTIVGKYVFTANTGSKTISRVIGTGNNVFVDGTVAASISTGGAPSDIDADSGVLAVIDHGAGESHLSLFAYNKFGELTASGVPVNLGAANANGIAIVAPLDSSEE
jgi:hypothetical protein